jgi:hypothetical protein
LPHSTLVYRFQLQSAYNFIATTQSAVSTNPFTYAISAPPGVVSVGVASVGDVSAGVSSDGDVTSDAASDGDVTSVAASDGDVTSDGDVSAGDVTDGDVSASVVGGSVDKLMSVRFILR